MQFKDVVGQPEVKQRLVQMVKENRISHALLFSELPGSGGLAMALAFAQYINCENNSGDDSCGVCPSCRKISKLAHPDLHFSFPSAKIDKKAKNGLCSELLPDFREAVLQIPYLQLNDWYNFVGVENKQAIIREEESDAIIHNLSLKAYEAKYKVHIMWQADKLNTTAANKLLKIIEEPPDSTLFILVTDNYEQILPTILSRTQLIKINKIKDADLTHALVNVYGLQQQQAQRMVHLSDSDYTAAYNLIKEEQAVLDIEKKLLDWLRLCYNIQKNYKQLVTWIEETLSDGGREAHKNFLAFGLQTAHEAIIANYAGASHSRFDETSFPGFARFSLMLHANNLEAFMNELTHAYNHIERNANAKILFLDLSFKMHALLHAPKPL
ncbi:MAG TPA: DNA polymerase III subunit [Bacteroidia bacterium]|nr:DNA polymerase III subunit [Bacteroidia bacterium]HNU33341.1 DNA polymerase III subunit [Bacteroidia bacterium]